MTFYKSLQHLSLNRRTLLIGCVRVFLIALFVSIIFLRILFTSGLFAQSGQHSAVNKPNATLSTATNSVLAAWRRKVASAKSRPINIVVIGDSIACCFGPSNYENVWTNVLRQTEALRYGDHGSGIIPIGKDYGLATNPQWSLHPESGSIDTVQFGPFQDGKGAFGSVFRLKGDARITVLLPVRPPDGVILYYATASDSAGGIRVNYDNQPGITVGKQASAVLKTQRIEIPPGGRGSSTLSFSAASVTSPAYLYGIEFTYGKAGISLHNVAHGYARSEAWGGDPDKQLSFLSQIDGGIQLAILSLGVNDSINRTGTTATEYHDHMAGIIAYLRALDPSMPIVLFDEISTVAGDSATPLPQRMVRDQEQLLAREFDVGYVSPLKVFGSPEEAVERGYLSHDNVHPTDLGDRYITSVIEKYLLFSTEDREQ